MSANRSGLITRSILDRASPLTQVLAETDSNGTITAYFIYGLGLISRIAPDGSAQYYHFDSRGSTVALTDASGQVTDTYAYDPFGGRTAASGSTDNRFRYLGRHGVVDEENGLNYIRARYYSTRRGRFITKDPTTGNDGDSQSLNRYVYALNNPVRLIDISGFSTQETGSGPSQLASSDNSLFHNVLISPMSSGLAGTTPQSLINSSSLGDRMVSLGDVVSSAGSSQSFMNLIKFTTRQQHLLNNAGEIAGIVGFAQSAVTEIGGVNNAIAGIENAQSNIDWLLHDATTDDWLGLGTTVTTKITAIAINSLASPVFSAINFFAGEDINVSGNEVESAVRSYVNFFQIQ